MNIFATQQVNKQHGTSLAVILKGVSHQETSASTLRLRAFARNKAGSGINEAARLCEQPKSVQPCAKHVY